MSSDFYSKFNKPTNWNALDPDQLIQVSVSDPAVQKKAANGVVPRKQLPSLLQEATSGVSDNHDYSFKIHPDELALAQPEVSSPAQKSKPPSSGILGYFAQKGNQLSDMITPQLSNLVKHFEGFRDTAYMPTKNDVPTIGYGMTKGVKLGDKITKDQADKMLDDHLQEYQDLVKSMVKVPLNSNQLDALTSLVYNVGPTAFRRSKALTALNSGDLDTFQREAFDPEHGFVHQDGEKLTGLVNRREKERELFNA